jgi:hypothetical protein
MSMFVLLSLAIAWCFAVPNELTFKIKTISQISNKLPYYPKLSRPAGSDRWYRFSELGGTKELELIHTVCGKVFCCNVSVCCFVVMCQCVVLFNVSVCCLRRVACATYCLRLKQIVVIIRWIKTLTPVTNWDCSVCSCKHSQLSLQYALCGRSETVLKNDRTALNLLH